MNSSHLVKILKSTKAYKGLSEKYILDIVSTIFSIISSKLNYQDDVKIKGFGSFMIKKHRMASGEIVNTIKFKASKNLLCKIN